jgi:hypothetical protein
MIPPKKPPQIHLAKKEVAGGRIPPGQWPCIHCWAKGCRKCSWTKLGSSVQFRRWYKQVIEDYEKKREEYQLYLDKIQARPANVQRGFIAGGDCTSFE